MFDLLIVGGRVVNGTGAPWFNADVGVRDGRITEVGRLAGAAAAKVIDIAGQVVCPGFIDMHSHSDFNLLVDPRAESKVRQGVTTEVFGQCGISAAPMDAKGLADVRERWGDALEPEIEWASMAHFLALLEERGMALNAAAVVGHGNLRRIAMGEENRSPTAMELDRMRELLSEGLEAGAFGMSTGLIYPPGVYSDSEELKALARVLGQRGATYFTHIRNERAQLVDAIREAIDIGRSGRCPVHIAHLKAFESGNWGLVNEALSVMSAARAEGVDVTADQYPYTASATVLRTTLPPWVHDGGKEAMLGRLRCETIRRTIKDEWGDEIDWNDVMVAAVRSDGNRVLEGMSIAEIAKHRGADPRDITIDLLLDEDGDVNMVYHGMCEEDVSSVMTHPLVMIGSDGGALSPRGPLAQGKPHPRSYGTFPRVLGHYVRGRGILTLEEAVSKMTAWPAARLGLGDRGILAPGFWADLAVFDPDRIEAGSTYVDPHRFPVGISHVIINGQVTVEEEEQHDALPGRVLRSRS